MMQSEFTELTKIHVDGAMYTEIENRYMESGMSKQEFCKAYKSNKDGMQEAVAYEASIKKAIEMDKKDQEIRSLKKEIETLKSEIESINRMWENRVNEERRCGEYNKNKAVGQAEEKAKAKEKEQEQEIMMLKAKLYDMMMNGVA